jgi:hypothetical protein
MFVLRTLNTNTLHRCDILGNQAPLGRFEQSNGDLSSFITPLLLDSNQLVFSIFPLGLVIVRDGPLENIHYSYEGVLRHAVQQAANKLTAVFVTRSWIRANSRHMEVYYCEILVRFKWIRFPQTHLLGCRTP